MSTSQYRPRTGVTDVAAELEWLKRGFPSAADSVVPRLYEKIASGYQPGRLSDSSRWSQRSEDHRNQRAVLLHPGGVPRFSATLFRVRNHFRFPSGGLRYAATTGYYLTAFQAGTRYRRPY